MPTTTVTKALTDADAWDDVAVLASGGKPVYCRLTIADADLVDLKVTVSVSPGGTHDDLVVGSAGDLDAATTDVWPILNYALISGSVIVFVLRGGFAEYAIAAKSDGGSVTLEYTVDAVYGHQAARPPTVTDDITTGVQPGDTWNDTVGGAQYQCISNGRSWASWRRLD